MAKPGGRTEATDRAAQADLHVLGDLDDETKVAILALNPTIAQVEQAGLWLNSREDVSHQASDPVVLQIIELVDVEDEDEPTPPR